MDNGRWITYNGRKIFIDTSKYMNSYIKNKGKAESEYKQYDEQLKKANSFDDIKKLIEDIDKTGEGLVIRTKRAKWRAFDFSKVGEDKVEYLLSNGISRRTQKIKDLYKYLEINNNAR